MTREIPDALALWSDLGYTGECRSYGCDNEGLLWPGFSVAFCIKCYVGLVEWGELDRKDHVPDGHKPSTEQLISIL